MERADGHADAVSTTTVLFTDVVGSTARAVALGDRAWAELLERHHEIVRRALSRHDGREMDTTGDGVFATFPEPVTAIRCAQALVGELRTLELEIRCGLHAGDCIVVDDKCTGLAVHIGARLVALAGPGEIVVSDAVRRLAEPAVRFVARGVEELRGVPGQWPVFAVGVGEGQASLT